MKKRYGILASAALVGALCLCALPCAVCALMVPPIISTMFLVIAIPRPVPWILNTAKKLYKAFEKAQAQHNNNM